MTAMDLRRPGGTPKGKVLGAILLAVALAALIHLDWHLARSTHHGSWSFGWSGHWILAIPPFALVAWYARRAWGANAVRAGLGVIILAAFLGQVVEPLAELATGATLEWTFGAERVGASLRYVALGILTFFVVLWPLRARST
jgi:hypothetical protein